MQDPLITIRAALSGGWNLTGDLAVANLNFRTGWYDKNFDNLQVCITPEPGGDNSPAQLGMRELRVWKRYHINAWVKAANTTNKGVGKAKQYIWSMQEEIKRLVLANKVGLTNLDWLLPDAEIQLDESDEVPPLLRWQYTVIVGYTISA